MQHLDGTWHSSSVPLQLAPASGWQYSGPVKGVVLAVYGVHDKRNRYRVGTVCDVVLYAGRRVLSRVPVMVSPGASGYRQRGGWSPSPTTRNLVTGAKLALSADATGAFWSAPVALADLDGSNVVVDFLDGLPTSPFIAGGLPHPRATAVDVAELGQDADEHPGLAAAGSGPTVAHAGTVAVVDDRGNVAVNTGGAGVGNNGSDAVAGDGPRGCVYLTLKAGGRVVASVGGAVLAIIGPDGVTLCGDDSAPRAAREGDAIALSPDLVSWLGKLAGAATFPEPYPTTGDGSISGGSDKARIG